MEQTIDETNQEERISLVKQIRRWGDLNTDALLEQGCKIFQAAGIDGFIGYQLHSKCAVVFGDPVSASEDKERLGIAFKEYCKKNHLNTIYAIASPEFAQIAMAKLCPIQIQFGNKLLLNPSIDPLTRTGSKGVLVRKKVKHASQERVTVQEYLSGNSSLEKEIEAIGSGWLKSRNGPQVYIAHLNFFADQEGKRIFVATQEEKVVGFLLLNEIQASQGWLLNNLMLAPNAPTGVSEMIIVSTFKALERENCKCVVVGPVTSDELNDIKGLGSFTSWSLRLLFKPIKKMFRLDGQTKFWEKFQPELEPSYLLFDKVNLRTIKALLRALNMRA